MTRVRQDGISMRHVAGAMALVLLWVAASVGAQAPDRLEPLPEALEDVGITEHLGGTVPLDLAFTDSQGQQVTLGQYFHDGKPVVLSMVYYECPMLCTLVLNGLADALKEMDWVPGNEFEMVTVSFNPAETAELAALKKRAYLNEYGRPEAARGWHFLVGSEENTQKLADAVGFGYRWNPETEQFVHQAAIMILMPDGRVSRYLYGIMYDARTLRLSLVEASDGKIGTTVDRFYLSCFQFDPTTGSYAMAALGTLRWAGTATLVLLIGAVVVFGLIGAKRRARARAAGAAAGEDQSSNHENG